MCDPAPFRDLKLGRFIFPPTLLGSTEPVVVSVIIVMDLQKSQVDPVSAAYVIGNHSCATE
jgi:hypothetical protein